MAAVSGVMLTTGGAAIRIDRCGDRVVIDLEAKAATDGKWAFNSQEFLKALGLESTR